MSAFTRFRNVSGFIGKFRYDESECTHLENVSAPLVRGAIETQLSRVAYLNIGGLRMNANAAFEDTQGNEYRFSRYGVGVFFRALGLDVDTVVHALNSGDFEFSARVVNAGIENAARKNIRLMCIDRTIEGVAFGGKALSPTNVFDAIREAINTDTFTTFNMEGLRIRLTYVNKEKLRHLQAFDRLYPGYDVVYALDNSVSLQLCGYVWSGKENNGAVTQIQTRLSRGINDISALCARIREMMEEADAQSERSIKKLQEAACTDLPKEILSKVITRSEKHFSKNFSSRLEKRMDSAPMLSDVWYATLHQAKAGMLRFRNIEVFATQLLNYGLKIRSAS